jgi:hypothetical protein
VGLAALVDAWRDERVELASPLSADEARARLRDALRSPVRSRLELGGSTGTYDLAGRIGADRLMLSTARVGLRNSWAPVVRGRLEPADGGSRLVARMGWHPGIKAVSALWLLGAAVAVPGLIAAGDAQFALVPLGMLVLFVALMVWGERGGRRVTVRLREFLAERLDATPSTPARDTAT